MLTKCIFYYNDIYEQVGYAVLFCNGIDNSFCNLHERTLLVYMTNIYIASIYLRDKSVRVLCNALSVHMTHLFCDTARVGTDMKNSVTLERFPHVRAKHRRPPFLLDPPIWFLGMKSSAAWEHEEMFVWQ